MEITIERMYFENIIEVHTWLAQEEYEPYWDNPEEYLIIKSTDPGYMVEHSTVFEY